MAASTVWGLDIGNSAIKAVKMVKVGEVCKIDEFDIVDIPNGEDDKDRPARVRQALDALTKSHRFGNDPIYVAVSTMQAHRAEFQLPPGSEDKLSDLVQYEAKQQIPFPLDQVEWGFERYDDPAGVGVILIAVRKNDVQELLTMAEALKLNVRGITTSPIALFNFIHYEFKPENTTLILDAGAKTTDFVVMSKRQVYFRTIQIAGREITRALENKLKVPFEKAEEIKKNIGESKQQDKILNVIEPTLRQLGAEIQRTIGFYKAKTRGRIQQCYLLGHTFRLPKMGENLQTQVREAPFVLVEGLQRVKLGNSLNSGVWEHEFPTMAVAVGLGLQGLGVSELKLNLLPEAEERKAAVAQWKGWMAAATVILSLTLGYSYVQASNAVNSYTNREASLADAQKNVKQWDEKVATAMQGLDNYDLAAKRLARAAHDRGKITQAFNQLCSLRNADGKSFFGPESKVYLTNLYISRIPFGTAAGAFGDSSAEMTALAHSEIFSGPGSLYASMGKGADTGTAPELRADYPLVVVLSGEVEGNGNDNFVLQKLKDLEDALKKLPEAKDVATPTHSDGPVRVETLIELDPVGNPKNLSATPGTPAEPSKERKVPTTIFHAVFRWDDPADLDIVPTAAPVEAPKNAAKK